MQTKPSSHLADQAIEQVLEFSADAQIKRRQAAKNSAEYQQLSGAIRAYGEALGVLLNLHARDESREASYASRQASYLLIRQGARSECTTVVS
jgi:hypothetical protein